MNASRQIVIELCDTGVYPISKEWLKSGYQPPLSLQRLSSSAAPNPLSI